MAATERFRYIINTKVNSAFYPSRVGKWSTSLHGWRWLTHLCRLAGSTVFMYLLKMNTALHGTSIDIVTGIGPKTTWMDNIFQTTGLHTGQNSHANRRQNQTETTCSWCGQASGRGRVWLKARQGIGTDQPDPTILGIEWLVWYLSNPNIIIPNRQ